MMMSPDVAKGPLQVGVNLGDDPGLSESARVTHAAESDSLRPHRL